MKKILRLSSLTFLMIFLFQWNASAQNTAPVAVDDSLIVYVYEANLTVYFDVLENDIGVEGQDIMICDLVPQGSTQNADFNDSIVFCYDPGLFELVYHYRICLVNNQDIKSNWAKLYVNPQYGENSPIARNDTIEGLLDYTYQINVLLNDTDPQGDSIYFHLNQNVVSDSILSVTVGWDYNIQTGYLEFIYSITNTLSDTVTTIDYARIVIKVSNPDWYNSLNINNVNARFNCLESHFWNLRDSANYFVPSSGTATSIFAGHLWVGGLDSENDLHLAGGRYRQAGKDFSDGPVSYAYSSTFDKKWLYMWKLNRDDIENHKAHWWEAGYEPLSDILSWPAHGDTSLHQSENIAPFEDTNNNGIYEPMQGDAPIIKGNQALYFVFNDARKPHTDTEGLPLGVEIHAMAYAFEMPNDSALWSTTFLQYQIINRSDTTYTDTYTAFFCDIDLGFPYDDYVGCNVEGGYFFAYNGNPIDNGNFESYGENPPAQAILFLGGARLVSDGIDNPKYDISGNQICDESINGLNFGDTIVDNERLGMTDFVYFNNGGASYMSDPNYAPDYYNYMKSIWKDGSTLQYGGMGNPVSGGVGPDCRFMFPGDTDSCNWGTNGIPPNGGLNTPGNYWTEESVGNNPSDIRGLGSSGPFTFAPGQVETLDLAFVWARAYDGDPWSSAELLEEYCAYIKNKFENDENFFIGVDQVTTNDENLLVYPNPAMDVIRLRLPPIIGKSLLSIYDNQGIVVFSRVVKTESDYQIDIDDWKSGLYFIRCVSDTKCQSGIFIKI